MVPPKSEKNQSNSCGSTTCANAQMRLSGQRETSAFNGGGGGGGGGGDVMQPMLRTFLGGE